MLEHKKKMGFFKVRLQRRLEVLGLYMNHLRCVMRLFIAHIKGHLFKVRLIKIPSCEGRYYRDSTASHILCDCDVLANLRSNQYGIHFIKASDNLNAPLSNV
jgi:hypothetical protein